MYVHFCFQSSAFCVLNLSQLGKGIDASKLRVTMQDFAAALAEVKPAFGASRDEFEVYRRNGTEAL